MSAPMDSEAGPAPRPSPSLARTAQPRAASPRRGPGGSGLPARASDAAGGPSSSTGAAPAGPGAHVAQPQEVVVSTFVNGSTLRAIIPGSVFPAFRDLYKAALTTAGLCADDIDVGQDSAFATVWYVGGDKVAETTDTPVKVGKVKGAQVKLVGWQPPDLPETFTPPWAGKGHPDRVTLSVADPPTATLEGDTVVPRFCVSITYGPRAGAAGGELDAATAPAATAAGGGAGTGAVAADDESDEDDGADAPALDAPALDAPARTRYELRTRKRPMKYASAGFGAAVAARRTPPLAGGPRVGPRGGAARTPPKTYSYPVGGYGRLEKVCDDDAAKALGLVRTRLLRVKAGEAPDPAAETSYTLLRLDGHDKPTVNTRDAAGAWGTPKSFVDAVDDARKDGYELHAPSTHVHFARVVADLNKETRDAGEPLTVMLSPSTTLNHVRVAVDGVPLVRKCLEVNADGRVAVAVVGGSADLSVGGLTMCSTPPRPDKPGWSDDIFLTGPGAGAFMDNVQSAYSNAVAVEAVPGKAAPNSNVLCLYARPVLEADRDNGRLTDHRPAPALSCCILISDGVFDRVNAEFASFLMAREEGAGAVHEGPSFTCTILVAVTGADPESFNIRVYRRADGDWHVTGQWGDMLAALKKAHGKADPVCQVTFTRRDDNTRLFEARVGDEDEELAHARATKRGRWGAGTGAARPPARSAIMEAWRAMDAENERVLECLALGKPIDPMLSRHFNTGGAGAGGRGGGEAAAAPAPPTSAAKRARGPDGAAVRGGPVGAGRARGPDGAAVPVGSGGAGRAGGSDGAAAVRGGPVGAGRARGPDGAAAVRGGPVGVGRAGGSGGAGRPGGPVGVGRAGGPDGAAAVRGGPVGVGRAGGSGGAGRPGGPVGVGRAGGSGGAAAVSGGPGDAAAAARLAPPPPPPPSLLPRPPPPAVDTAAITAMTRAALNEAVKNKPPAGWPAAGAGFADPPPSYAIVLAVFRGVETAARAAGEEWAREQGLVVALSATTVSVRRGGGGITADVRALGG